MQGNAKELVFLGKGIVIYYCLCCKIVFFFLLVLKFECK